MSWEAAISWEAAMSWEAAISWEARGRILSIAGWYGICVVAENTR
jgi:hypothetical protein